MNAIQFENGSKDPSYHSKKLNFQHISIDGDTHSVVVEGMPVYLTFTEFEILYLLASSPNKTLSAKEIYRHVWQMDDLGKIGPVLAQLSNLRNKLRTACPEYKFIETKWKRGYQFILHKAAEEPQGNPCGVMG